jgi:hypothetical protein
MPDRVTLDVIDRPAGGVRRTLKQVRAIRGLTPAGMRALLALGTARLVPHDARDYAFGPGGHLDAVRRDRARGHHKSESFLRLRPLVERGSLAGTTPLARGALPGQGSPRSAT